MEQAAVEEKQRRAAEASRKRTASSGPSENPDVKRVKLDDGAPSPLAGFDFTTLPANLVTDLIVANLQAFSEPTLISLVQGYLSRTGAPPLNIPPAPSPDAVPPPGLSSTPSLSSIPLSAPGAGPSTPTGPSASKPSAPPPTAPRADRERAAAAAAAEAPQSTPPASTPAEPVVKDEPVDPLKMDIDDDEVEYAPEKLTDEVSRSPVFCLFIFNKNINNLYEKIPIYSSICLRPLRKQKQNSKQRKPTLTSPSTSRNSACLHLKNFQNPIEMVLYEHQCLEYGTARTTLPLMATHRLRQNRQRICGCC